MPATPPAFTALLHRPVITLDDAVSAYRGNRRAASQALHAMNRRGYLVKVRRALYVIGPRQDPGWKSTWDPYVVASRVRPDAVVAFHSALVVRGVAQNPAERTVHLATGAPLARFSFQGVKFFPFATAPRILKRLASEFPRAGEVIRVARPEWTIAMVCRNPTRGGGFEEIIQSATGLRRIDPREVFEACEALGSRWIFNRAGYLLWLNRRNWRVAPEELTPFKRRMSKGVALFGAGPQSAAYVAEWRLYIPRSAQGVVESVNR